MKYYKIKNFIVETLFYYKPLNWYRWKTVDNGIIIEENGEYSVYSPISEDYYKYIGEAKSIYYNGAEYLCKNFIKNIRNFNGEKKIDTLGKIIIKEKTK